MENPGDKDAQRHTPRAKGRVLLLWFLIGGAFLVFSGIFLQRHFYLQEISPARYEQHAVRLRTEGKTGEAIAWVRQHIDRYHPPLSAPYALLADLAEETGAMQAAQTAAAKTQFYTGRQTPNIDQAAEHWRKALTILSDAQPGCAPAPPGADYIRQIAPWVLERRNDPSLMKTWPAGEIVTLLQIGGHSFSCNGMVAGVKSAEDIVAVSCGGPGQGKRAQIWLRGRDFSAGGRGLNALLLDAGTGQVRDTGLFDIWDREEEAYRMVDFLRAAPDGCIGVFAVADDASVNMTPALESELLRFGLYREAYVQDEAVLFGLRYSFAAIGVKGSNSGTALQAWSPDQFMGISGHPAACGILRSTGGAP